MAWRIFIAWWNQVHKQIIASWLLRNAQDLCPNSYGSRVITIYKMASVSVDNL